MLDLVHLTLAFAFGGGIFFIRLYFLYLVVSLAQAHLMHITLGRLQMALDGWRRSYYAILMISR